VGIEERVAALESWRERVEPMIAMLHAGFPGAKAEIHAAKIGVDRIGVELHDARQDINVYVEESLRPLRVQLKGLDGIAKLLGEINKKLETQKA
jgi:hypothetical protein